MGSNDLINSIDRYALWINDSQYQLLKNNDLISSSVSQVRLFRMKSKKKSTKLMAEKPYEFGEIRYKNEPSIIVPGVSSENRIYAPMAFVDKDTIISNAAFAIYGAPLWLMGVLESKMHMSWLKAIGGKLETRYRYSAVLVYNTFPVPELSTRRKNEIEDLVWKILDIRDEEGGTLAELYGAPLAAKNPQPMNPRLKAAHEELDQVVDRAYRDRPFRDDNERLALLLDMYSNKVGEANEQ